jgi:hypothetical protein
VIAANPIFEEVNLLQAAAPTYLQPPPLQHAAPLLAASYNMQVMMTIEGISQS